jgi:hypothetical protein
MTQIIDRQGCEPQTGTKVVQGRNKVRRGIEQSTVEIE